MAVDMSAIDDEFDLIFDENVADQKPSNHDLNGDDAEVPAMLKYLVNENDASQDTNVGSNGNDGMVDRTLAYQSITTTSVITTDITQDSVTMTTDDNIMEEPKLEIDEGEVGVEEPKIIDENTSSKYEITTSEHQQTVMESMSVTATTNHIDIIITPAEKSESEVMEPQTDQVQEQVEKQPEVQGEPSQEKEEDPSEPQQQQQQQPLEETLESATPQKQAEEPQESATPHQQFEEPKEPAVPLQQHVGPPFQVNGVLSMLTKNDADIENKTIEQQPSAELLQAQEEWDALETVEPDSGQEFNQSPVISFNEVLAHFQRSDMSEYMKNIKPTQSRSGFAAFKHLLFGPPKMKKDLHEERNLVFAIAHCSLDNGETIHGRTLQSIYKRLTGSKFDCPRYGSHWEQIGFQGNDPSTDLRATGFLGLMTLLYFVMDPTTLPLARDIYKLSLHEEQNFPFCLMSINMTRIALQALREESLSKECNRRQQVFGVINDFYVGVYLHLYQIWKKQHKTIKDSGFVLKDVESFAKKNPRNIIRNLETYLNERSKNQSVKKAVNEEPMDFAGVHELEQE
ncbi:ELMO domain-containing protein 3-like [Glandiceps talaboti]